MKKSFPKKSLSNMSRYRRALFHLGTLCRITLFLHRQDSWKQPQCPSGPGECGRNKCGRNKCGPDCPMSDNCGSLPDVEAEPKEEGRHLPQYLAALSATLGALAAGSTVGWSAPVMVKLTGNSTSGYDFPVTPLQGDWMASMVTLGAAFVCYPIGLIMDTIGRKKTMLLLTIPFVCGWTLITFGTAVNQLIIGRFITGMAGGAFCITAPAYTSEIAQKSVKGTMGTFFHLMTTVGILLAFTIGGHVTIFIFNVFCSCVPIIFCFLFFFMPESPMYLLMKNRNEEARQALVRLRGKDTNVDRELDEMKARVKEVQEENEKNKNCLTPLKKKTALKAIFICYTLMFYQQLTGLTAMTFNAPRMFADAGAKIPWTITTIIIAIFQVGATFICTMFVDRLGKRILLLISSMIMCVCCTIVGISFYLEQALGFQNEFVKSITWLPLICLFLFLIAFSLGFGPIPWLMAAELCRMDIKAFVASTSGTLSWLLTFIGASTFYALNAKTGTSVMFCMFATIMLTAFLFVYFVIPETKGMSTEEIQALLAGRFHHRAKEKKSDPPADVT